MVTANTTVPTKTEGKYVVFILRNGVRVKIDPNKAQLGDSVKKHVKEEK